MRDVPIYKISRLLPMGRDMFDDLVCIGLMRGDKLAPGVTIENAWDVSRAGGLVFLPPYGSVDADQTVALASREDEDTGHTG